ncbi:[FeFe] hydrogenase H-cluster radical SAM maturase HydE [Maridesulfovibrio bastinii]|uniref:[FeFe] hydrogenase H-cluster radical SAM maturase HydE n=1 Tax=Maridesulfovibrio bastinii TaxID=47157 RepID=UPI0003FD5A6A|nr:[FeFe] hydrogenase H-cluster radical SAM maturase HydE [Maridesulfovibrio bastinii]
MNRSEILEALCTEGNEQALFERAEEVRLQNVGNEVQLRGVIHFSNYCVRNDLYCGLSVANKSCKRFRMDKETILNAAYSVADYGLKTVVLQSGEDRYYSLKDFCSIIETIREKTDMAVTLSLGERSQDEFEALRSAGAERYLMKHETMNPELYSYMRSGLKLADRLKQIETLRKVGFQTGVGNIVGLPGQTVDDLCDDIMFFQDFQPDMVNVGPFIPHAQTPLKNEPVAAEKMLLKVFALTRIVTGNTHMAAANTVATMNPENGQYQALTLGGANVLMPNCNPFPESKKDKVEYEFQITTRKRYVSVEEARKLLKRAGRTEGEGKGHSLKIQGEQL